MPYLNEEILSILNGTQTATPFASPNYSGNFNIAPNKWNGNDFEVGGLLGGSNHQALNNSLPQAEAPAQQQGGGYQFADLSNYTGQLKDLLGISDIMSYIEANGGLGDKKGPRTEVRVNLDGSAGPIRMVDTARTPAPPGRSNTAPTQTPPPVRQTPTVPAPTPAPVRPAPVRTPTPVRTPSTYTPPINYAEPDLSFGGGLLNIPKYTPPAPVYTPPKPTPRPPVKVTPKKPTPKSTGRSLPTRYGGGRGGVRGEYY